MAESGRAVELWFVKVERDKLARGIFTSVADRRRKITKYVWHDGTVPTPVRVLRP